MSDGGTRRRTLFAALAAGVGLLLIELGAGAALRARAPALVDGGGADARGRGILLHGDPSLLWRLAPGDRVEHGQPVHVNAAGFRDRERGPATGPRLLALGDSSIYGFGVSDRAVFTARLEAQLGGVEVINGGVPGYSTEQALNLLEAQGLALAPDVLLVGALWSDNNFDRFVDAERLGAHRAWRIDPVAQVAAFISGTATGRLIRRILGDEGPEAEAVGWMEAGEQGGGRRRVPLQDYAENLARFCSVMSERGGGVVFVLLANVEDLQPRPGTPPWAPYRDAMVRTAAACDAPLVSIPDAFIESGLPPGQLFLDEMHPSSRGHGLMAVALAAVLAAEGWPETPIGVVDPGGAVEVDDDPFEGR
ncbi:MAG: GDSL-type esterase/lipase family protein, partial [Myxococcota bacterium]|nr:GDSL-type esterase/lipase family protein [Myxococcota bacterium]